MKTTTGVSQATESLNMGLDAMVTNAAQDVLANYKKLLDDNLQLIIDASKQVSDIAKHGALLRVQVADTTVELKGLKHQNLDQLITLCANNMPVLMVGMAGTGKTHAGEQVATALGFKFYAISVGAQTSKSDIMGYMNATGAYVRTLFREAYEKGGVFLMDEIDAGNSNVLIQINAALSNNYCAFPDKMVKRHKDFRFIATANTFGFGVSRMYVGRNQLDAATLDRFAVLNWDIDETLEKALVGNDKLGKAWLKVVHKVRAQVVSESLRALVTPRATLRGMAMLNAGVSFEDTLRMALLNGIPGDRQDAISRTANSAWDN